MSAPPIAGDFIKAISEMDSEDNLVAAAAELLQRGADINEKDDGGNTPLIEAICQDHLLGLAPFLITHGASLDDKNNHGYNALHLVATSGYLSVAKLLIENGADITVLTDRTQQTAEELAIEHHHPEIAAILQEAAAAQAEVKARETAHQKAHALARNVRKLPFARKTF